MPSIAKYVFHYLFAQAEFGLLCPVNLTDSSSELVRRFGVHGLPGGGEVLGDDAVDNLHARPPTYRQCPRLLGRVTRVDGQCNIRAGR